MATAKKTKSGNYRVQIYDYTDVENKKHYKSFTAKTKKEAEYKANQYLMFKPQAKETKILTLHEAFELYIDNRSKVLSASTINGYKQIQRNYFQDLMPLKINQIKNEDVQHIVNEMSAKLSAKTIKNAYSLLHAVCKIYAPALKISATLPAKRKKFVEIPTLSEVNQMIDLAPNVIKIPIILASKCGLRRSEIAALSPSDVTENYITVSKSSVVSPLGGFVVQNRTKSVAGTRIVPINREIYLVLRGWEDWGISPASISSHYSRFIQKNQLKFYNFHKLRHFFASFLHSEGVPNQYIAKIGGWDTIQVLEQIYQHTLADYDCPEVLKKLYKK